MIQRWWVGQAVVVVVGDRDEKFKEREREKDSIEKRINGYRERHSCLLKGVS